MGESPLSNAKYELFSQLVATGEPEMHAYTKAGFKESSAKRNAHRLKNRVEIANRVAYLLKQAEDIQHAAVVEAARKVGVDKEWVMQSLVEVHTLAVTGEPIMNKDGVEVGRRMDLSNANRSLELIGKELGMFTVKVETAENDPLLALLRRVQGHSLKVVHDVSEVEDD
jgi:phage terminase small subunit